jgi:hypothetical protein
MLAESIAPKSETYRNISEDFSNRTKNGPEILGLLYDVYFSFAITLSYMEHRIPANHTRSQSKSLSVVLASGQSRSQSMQFANME